MNAGKEMGGYKHTGFFTQKSDENSRMRLILNSNFPPKCAHALILVAFL